MIEALLALLPLKALPRAGWVQRGVGAPESVAAHTWGVAALGLLLCPPHLDRGRVLAYAVLHDLPEVRTGDLTPRDAVPADEKRRREAAAMVSLTTGLPGGADALALWRAYEDQADAEARFVRQLDALDMALQAVAYAREAGLDPAEFLESAAQRVEDPLLVEFLAAARAAAG